MDTTKRTKAAAARRPTFEELVQLEPRLGMLERDIRSIKRPYRGRFCANEIWYQGFKPKLVRMVGWLAPKDAPPALRTIEAYDVAYDHLYELLPNCRRCACL
jgi:hypothetical protein